MILQLLIYCKLFLTLNVLKELKPLYEDVAELKSILQSIQLQQFEQNKKVNDKLERMEALLIGWEFFFYDNYKIYNSYFTHVLLLVFHHKSE